MIFSIRRKRDETARPSNATLVLIRTDDTSFAEKIGKAIEHWGFRLQEIGPGTEVEAQAAADAALALLDIRELADETFGVLQAIRQRYPGLEVVLINKPDNVVASIAGMKAGALDEIIVPVDTAHLQSIITEACRRRQAARVKKTKKPLLARFSEAMMAATFAQAGDFEGALEMMDDQSVPARTGKVPSTKKDSGT